MDVAPTVTTFNGLEIKDGVASKRITFRPRQVLLLWFFIAKKALTSKSVASNVPEIKEAFGVGVMETSAKFRVGIVLVSQPNLRASAATVESRATGQAAVTRSRELEAQRVANKAANAQLHRIQQMNLLSQAEQENTNQEAPERAERERRMAAEEQRQRAQSAGLKALDEEHAKKKSVMQQAEQSRLLKEKAAADKLAYLRMVEEETKNQDQLRRDREEARLRSMRCEAQEQKRKNKEDMALQAREQARLQADEDRRHQVEEKRLQQQARQQEAVKDAEHSYRHGGEKAAK
ncbi:hypothetical protein NM208_g14022 [Fusarium decemcellulare]|uniref:Uncharacterized protein n=1 Tax=Fusarium decemcellulare TaxID=57161 RepID=A0ACC1RK75_9HYPO|nr:hypothetical protein NM208_g14022 [Fusarium decemcellulare]